MTGFECDALLMGFLLREGVIGAHYKGRDPAQPQRAGHFRIFLFMPISQMMTKQKPLSIDLDHC